MSTSLQLAFIPSSIAMRSSGDRTRRTQFFTTQYIIQRSAKKLMAKKLDHLHSNLPNVLQCVSLAPHCRLHRRHARGVALIKRLPTAILSLGRSGNAHICTGTCSPCFLVCTASGWPAEPRFATAHTGTSLRSCCAIGSSTKQRRCSRLCRASSSSSISKVHIDECNAPPARSGAMLFAQRSAHNVPPCGWMMDAVCSTGTSRVHCTAALQCTALHCTALCTALHCTAPLLHCSTALHCTALTQGSGKAVRAAV